MPLRDFLALTFVCLMWAVSNVVSKYAVSDLGTPPLLLASVRFAVVCLVTLPWLFPAPKPVWRMVAAALLMGGANFALLFIGLQYATASSAAVVVQAGVPMMVLLSVLMLGETVRWRRAIGMALTLTGVGLVIWNPDGLTASVGLWFVVASAFTGALGSIMLKKIPTLKPLQFQAWVGATSVLALTPMSLALEPHPIQSLTAGGWPLVAAVLFSALIVSVLGHTMFYGIIRRHEATLIAPLTLMTPLFTIGLGVAFMHEPFGPRMALGTAFALAGVLVVALRRSALAPILLALRARVQ